MTTTPLSNDVFNIDYAAETEKIVKAIRNALRSDFKRQGLIIAISGQAQPEHGHAYKRIPGDKIT